MSLAFSSLAGRTTPHADAITTIFSLVEQAYIASSAATSSYQYVEDFVVPALGKLHQDLAGLPPSAIEVQLAVLCSSVNPTDLYTDGYAIIRKSVLAKLELTPMQVPPGMCGLACVTVCLVTADMAQNRAQYRA